jgi:transposase
LNLRHRVHVLHRLRIIPDRKHADANLTLRMRNLVDLLWSEWKDLEHQIVAMNLEVEQIASSDPACQRLRQIPGIGPLVANDAETDLNCSMSDSPVGNN